MYKIVLVRHGESEWNKENRFTGWTDVGLSAKGLQEAHDAGKVLKKEGYVFDLAYTSVLKRAIKTLDNILEEMGLEWLPVIKDYRLNERHYGSLQGLNKSETAEKYGEDQVKIWRRSYSVPPPAMTKEDERWAGRDPRYSELREKDIPLAESLKLTVARVIPYWKWTITPSLKQGKKIIVAAHGNSLRALVKHLDNVSEKEITELNIPTGIPLVYELDKWMKPLKKYYLCDEETAKKAMESVANQGKKKC